MFVVTLSKSSVKKLGVGAMCCALVVFSAMLGRYISTRSVAVAAASNKIESAQDIQTWFTGYGLDVDGASITADKVKIPRKWDDSFSAFNGVVQQSGMDLARYKGKTVEKWTALIPAASRGDVSSYGVLLVYKKKAVGAYLLEKPSGTVTGLKDAQTAMALQEAEQVSGEDFSGDWGERHDGELGAESQAQQTSGEGFQRRLGRAPRRRAGRGGAGPADLGRRFQRRLGRAPRRRAGRRGSGPADFRRAGRLHRSSPCSTPTCRWTPRDTPSNNRHSVQKSAMKQKNCAVVVFLQKDSVQCY